MKKVWIVLGVLFLALAVAIPAYAITYGEPDDGRHPNVGVLAVDTGERYAQVCTGTLISPTVFLTAAHCYVGFDTVYVSFDEVFSQAGTFYQGQMYIDARYTFHQNDPHDIAVVVFEQPINITPAGLPTLGQFDDLSVGALFTAVGYGRGEVVNQAGGPVNPRTGQREMAVSSLNALNKAWLRLSQNPNTGDAGTCYGDSGGPNFYGAGDDETDIVAAITITGDALCKATNVVYRLDTVAAREFLAKYVTLP